MTDSEPGWFLVTSIGRTATYWLSWSLNRHPEILCSHGRHFPPTIHSLHDNSRVSVSLSEVGQPIRSIYEIPDNEASGVDDKEVRQSQQVFNGKTIGEFLDAHRQFGESQLFGNVHAYVLSEVIYRLNAQEAGRSFALINLVRNPVGQILSFFRRHLFDAQRSEAYMAARQQYLARKPNLVETVRDRFNVDISASENMVFLSTVIDVAKMQQDICIESALHVPYELLTTSQDAFRKFVGALAKPRDIAVDSEYLDEVFAQGPMNYSSSAETPVEEIYKGLEDWQKFVIRDQLTEDVMSRYTTLGYDLEFFSGSR